MGIGDLNDGSRYGLRPIGLPEADLATGTSDTRRRQMPASATKNSVFAWTGSPSSPQLLLRTVATGTLQYTVNLRNNTAPLGVSVDVPVWAAGAVILFQMTPSTMGTSTYFRWNLTTPIAPTGVAILDDEQRALPLGLVGRIQQVIMPFFDEPTFLVSFITDGNGTALFGVYLLGFVRNV